MVNISKAQMAKLELFSVTHTDNVTPQWESYSVQGLYERVTDAFNCYAWQLRFWRILFTRKDGSVNPSAPEWHKVHGNQRKDIGELKLVRRLPVDKRQLDNYRTYGTLQD